MHNILYNYVTLKIEGCDNSASEDSRSQKTGTYNNFTMRLIDKSIEIIRCYMTSKCIANNNKKMLYACCWTICENTPFKYTMEHILKTGTVTGTNKLGYVSIEYRSRMFTLLLPISHFMTIHQVVLFSCYRRVNRMME